jgi:glucans biosynthesis protein C
LPILQPRKPTPLRHDPNLAAALRRDQRHYGLDWLRIAAFGLLILYHIGMVFAPWSWVINAPYRIEALIPPMALVTPWRLALLFAVSGYASARLFARDGDAGGFARSRAKRLLVPLAFGMAVLVPLEMWVRVMENGYPYDYPHFWSLDYWRAGMFWHREFPSWEHLWFVAYLAAYSFLLAGALAWQRARIEAAFAAIARWLAEGHRLVWVPIAALAIARLALLFVVPEQQGLLRDWGGHSQYLPLFLAGFVLAQTPGLWPAIHRAAAPALGIAALSGAIVVLLELRYAGNATPPHELMALDRAARTAMAWSMVVALFHLAERHWNRDHRWRRSMAEAVFPFYIVHQPAIVLIAWYSLPLGLPPLAEFALLLGGTLAACLATYLVGRRIGWLRPLIGLAPLARARQSAREAQPAIGAP